MNKMTDYERVLNWLEYHEFKYETEKEGRYSGILAEIPVKLLKNFKDEDQVINIMISFNFLTDRGLSGKDNHIEEITNISIVGLVDFKCDSVLLSNESISMRRGNNPVYDIYIYNR